MGEGEDIPQAGTADPGAWPGGLGSWRARMTGSTARKGVISVVDQAVVSGSNFLTALLLAALWPTPALAEGMLQRLRDDVRGASSGSSDDSDDDDRSDRRDRRDRHHSDDDHFGGHCHDDDDGGGFSGFIVFESGQLAFYTLTSPFWAPHAALGDDLSRHDCFPRFPYDRVSGYMMTDPCACQAE